MSMAQLGEGTGTDQARHLLALAEELGLRPKALTGYPHSLGGCSFQVWDITRKKFDGRYLTVIGFESALECRVHTSLDTYNKTVSPAKAAAMMQKAARKGLR